MGKLSPADLNHYIFSRTRVSNDGLLVKAGYGEDAAAVATNKETVAVNTDPVLLATKHIGALGVAIVSNGMAACGGVPEWFVSTVLLPGLGVDLLDDITAQLDMETERLGVGIVDGHTEMVTRLSRPLLSLTCMSSTDRYVPTSGAKSGGAVILTKGAGVGGTTVLATDSRVDLDAASVELAATNRAADSFGGISVLPESAVLAPAATAMYDPTEDGVLSGLVELACASGVRIEVDGGDMPVRPETRVLCEVMGVDPIRILGSGVLLAAVPEGETDDALAALECEDIEAMVIGTVGAAGGGTGSNADADSTAPAADVVHSGTRYADDIEDDMCDPWN